MWFYAIAFIIPFLYIYFKNKRREKKLNLPPGPYGLPVLGFYPFLSEKPFEQISKLAEKYGDIMRINLLGEDFYVINSMRAMNEAFVKQGDNFSGRPSDQFNLVSVLHSNKGLVMSEGHFWDVHRNFLMGKLNGLGMGKTDFQDKIHECCDDLIEYIESNHEKLENLVEPLANFTSNVISTILFSERLGVEDPIYVHLRVAMVEIMHVLRLMNSYLTGPLFRFLSNFRRKEIEIMKENEEYLYDYVYQRYKRRLQSDTIDEGNDILDYYIQEMNGPNAKYFNEKTLKRNFSIMFVAGTDTSSTTLNHMLNLMALFPDIQDNVFKEIDEKVGKDRRVTILDRDLLPYTQAVIAEVQRHACVSPFGITHVNKKETTVCGYTIPKRSKVLINIMSLSKDKEQFPNPDAFDVNNFLNENGNFVANEANIPFSIGKRKCLGSKLAETEMFIAFVRLIQAFEWRGPNGERVRRELHEGVVRNVLPYKFTVIKRQ